MERTVVLHFHFHSLSIMIRCIDSSISKEPGHVFLTGKPFRPVSDTAFLDRFESHSNQGPGAVERAVHIG